MAGQAADGQIVQNQPRTRNRSAVRHNDYVCLIWQVIERAPDPCDYIVRCFSAAGPKGASLADDPVVKAAIMWLDQQPGCRK